MNMKRVLSIFSCLVLLMSIFSSISINAIEEAYEPKLESINFNQVGKNLNYTFEIDKNGGSDISQVQLNYKNGENTASITFNNQESSLLKLEYLGGKSYRAQCTTENLYGYPNSLVSGTYQLTTVSLFSTNSEYKTYSSESDLYPSESNDKSWSAFDLEVEINPEITAPTLKSISTSDDLTKINAPAEVNFDVVLENIPEGFNPYIELKYYNVTKNDINNINIGYSYNNGKINLWLNEAIKYIGSDFKLLYINIYASKWNGTTATTTNHNYYSSLTKEELKGYSGCESIADNVISLQGIANKNLDIKVSNYQEDNTTPSVSAIGWSKNNVKTPCIAKFKYQAEDLESGLSYSTKIFYKKDNSNTIIDDFGSAGSQYDSTTKMGELNFSFSRYDSTKSIEVVGLSVEDQVGNTTLICLDQYKNEILNFYTNKQPDKIETMQPISKLTLEKFQKYDAIMDISDPDLITKLKNSTEGKTYVINTYASRKLKKELFSAIKDRNITLIFENTSADNYNSSGIQWIINGKDINKEIKDIDITTQISNYNEKVVIDENNGGWGFTTGPGTLEERNTNILDQLQKQSVLKYYYDYVRKFDVKKDDLTEIFISEMKKNESVKMTFQPNGQLPGKFKIRVKLDYAMRGYFADKDLNAFYVNGDKYDLVGSGIEKEDDESYAFDITHNSTYLLTPKNLGNGSDRLTGSKVDTGDTTNSLLWISMLMGSVFILIGYTLKKEK